MIRRDYILRMIEEFIRVLARIHSLKRDQRWQEAATDLQQEFHRLIGAGADSVAQLSETVLLARLVQGEPTQVVHQKTLLLTTLLKEAGDIAAAQDRPDESRSCYLKGLHLLLHVLATGEISDLPHFVPKIELFLSALEPESLPMRTLGLLMHHYERTQEFARAEDALFSLLDLQPFNPELLDFGIAFFERLQNQSDAALEAGNLPRSEVEAGLRELSGRKKSAGNIRLS